MQLLSRLWKQQLTKYEVVGPFFVVRTEQKQRAVRLLGEKLLGGGDKSETVSNQTGNQVQTSGKRRSLTSDVESSNGRVMFFLEGTNDCS